MPCDSRSSLLTWLYLESLRWQTSIHVFWECFQKLKKSGGGGDHYSACEQQIPETEVLDWINRDEENEPGTNIHLYIPKADTMCSTELSCVCTALPPMLRQIVPWDCESKNFLSLTFFCHSFLTSMRKVMNIWYRILGHNTKIYI